MPTSSTSNTNNNILPKDYALFEQSLVQARACLVLIVDDVVVFRYPTTDFNTTCFDSSFVNLIRQNLPNNSVNLSMVNNLANKINNNSNNPGGSPTCGFASSPNSQEHQKFTPSHFDPRLFQNNNTEGETTKIASEKQADHNNTLENNNNINSSSNLAYLLHLQHKNQSAHLFQNPCEILGRPEVAFTRALGFNSFQQRASQSILRFGNLTLIVNPISNLDDRNVVESGCTLVFALEHMSGSFASQAQVCRLLWDFRCALIQSHFSTLTSSVASNNTSNASLTTSVITEENNMNNNANVNSSIQGDNSTSGVKESSAANANQTSAETHANNSNNNAKKNSSQNSATNNLHNFKQHHGSFTRLSLQALRFLRSRAGSTAATANLIPSTSLAKSSPASATFLQSMATPVQRDLLVAWSTLSAIAHHKLGFTSDLDNKQELTETTTTSATATTTAANNITAATVNVAGATSTSSSSVPMQVVGGSSSSNSSLMMAAEGMRKVPSGSNDGDLLGANNNPLNAGNPLSSNNNNNNASSPSSPLLLDENDPSLINFDNENVIVGAFALDNFGDYIPAIFANSASFSWVTPHQKDVLQKMTGALLRRRLPHHSRYESDGQVLEKLLQGDFRHMSHSIVLCQELICLFHSCKQLLEVTIAAEVQKIADSRTFYGIPQSIPAKVYSTEKFLHRAKQVLSLLTVGGAPVIRFPIDLTDFSESYGSSSGSTGGAGAQRRWAGRNPSNIGYAYFTEFGPPFINARLQFDEERVFEIADALARSVSLKSISNNTSASSSNANSNTNDKNKKNSDVARSLLLDNCSSSSESDSGENVSAAKSAQKKEAARKKVEQKAKKDKNFDNFYTTVSEIEGRLFPLVFRAALIDLLRVPRSSNNNNNSSSTSAPHQTNSNNNNNKKPPNPLFSSNSNNNGLSLGLHQDGVSNTSFASNNSSGSSASLHHHHHHQDPHHQSIHSASSTSTNIFNSSSTRNHAIVPGSHLQHKRVVSQPPLPTATSLHHQHAASDLNQSHHNIQNNCPSSSSSSSSFVNTYYPAANFHFYPNAFSVTDAQLCLGSNTFRQIDLHDLYAALIRRGKSLIFFNNTSNGGNGAAGSTSPSSSKSATASELKSPESLLHQQLKLAIPSETFSSIERAPHSLWLVAAVLFVWAHVLNRGETSGGKVAGRSKNNFGGNFTVAWKKSVAQQRQEEQLQQQAEAAAAAAALAQQQQQQKQQGIATTTPVASSPNPSSSSLNNTMLVPPSSATTSTSANFQSTNAFTLQKTNSVANSLSSLLQSSQQPSFPHPSPPPPPPPASIKKITTFAAIIGSSNTNNNSSASISLVSSNSRFGGGGGGGLQFHENSNNNNNASVLFLSGESDLLAIAPPIHRVSDVGLRYSLCDLVPHSWLAQNNNNHNFNGSNNNSSISGGGSFHQQQHVNNPNKSPNSLSEGGSAGNRSSPSSFGDQHTNRVSSVSFCREALSLNPKPKFTCPFGARPDMCIFCNRVEFPTKKHRALNHLRSYDPLTVSRKRALAELEWDDEDVDDDTENGDEGAMKQPQDEKDKMMMLTSSSSSLLSPLSEPSTSSPVNNSNNGDGPMNAVVPITNDEDEGEDESTNQVRQNSSVVMLPIPSSSGAGNHTAPPTPTDPSSGDSLNQVSEHQKKNKKEFTNPRLQKRIAKRKRKIEKAKRREHERQQDESVQLLSWLRYVLDNASLASDTVKILKRQVPEQVPLWAGWVFSQKTGRNIFQASSDDDDDDDEEENFSSSSSSSSASSRSPDQEKTKKIISAVATGFQIIDDHHHEQENSRTTTATATTTKTEKTKHKKKTKKRRSLFGSNNFCDNRDQDQDEAFLNANNFILFEIETELDEWIMMNEYEIDERMLRLCERRPDLASRGFFKGETLREFMLNIAKHECKEEIRMARDELEKARKNQVLKKISRRQEAQHRELSSRREESSKTTKKSQGEKDDGGEVENYNNNADDDDIDDDQQEQRDNDEMMMEVLENIQMKRRNLGRRSERDDDDCSPLPSSSSPISGKTAPHAPMRLTGLIKSLMGDSFGFKDLDSLHEVLNAFEDVIFVSF